MEAQLHCQNCGHRFPPNSGFGARCPKCQYYVEPRRMGFAGIVGLILIGLTAYGLASGLISPQRFVQAIHAG